MALETQRAALGDAVVDALIHAAQEKLAALPPDAHADLPHRHSERKRVTVVIVDVKGSTQILEKIGTEAWVALMNRIFHTLEAEITRFGGEVDQFRGDGLVAFFGASTTHEDDPERGVLASLAMQRAMEPLAAKLELREELTLLLRIGVNTGEVIVGRMGERQHREDTAMGEAITLAARMEAAAEPGTVLVSEHTYRLTEAQFKWQALGTLSAKGIRQPLAIYRPLASRATPAKARGIAGLTSPLVGRESELQALQEALTRLREGEGGIVTLVGEAGLGKSRLIAELRETALGASGPAQQRTKPATKEMMWVEGRCLSYGTTFAYQLWLDVLHGLLGVTQEDDPETVRAALRKTQQTLDRAGCRYPQRVKTLATYLGRLLSLPSETLAGSSKDTQPPDGDLNIANLSGEELKRGIFRAVECLVEGLARQRPLVIICEDLHWADPTSLELLERLFALTHHVPLLFICVLRPETAHGGALVQKIAAQRYGRQHTNLWLVPLSSHESEALVHHLLQRDGLPHRLKTRILNHAEGNPFYLEELIRSLLENGTVRWNAEANRWEAVGDVVRIKLPNTLYGVLMARIDRLPPPAKRVLQLAAVVGRQFNWRVLSALAQNGHDLGGILLTLQEEELIHAWPVGQDEDYAFKHHLIQETAYNGLLQEQKRTIHQRVAKVLEHMPIQREEEQVGLLAYHWEQAGESAPAAAYLLRAGQQAAMQFANVEAIHYFSRALPLVAPNSSERFALLTAREKVYDLQGAREAQLRDLNALESLARRLQDPQREAEVALRRAAYAEAIGEYAGAIEAAQRTIRLARRARDAHCEAAGYLRWGRALFYRGELQEARRQLQRALDRAADGFPQVQAECLRSLGMAASDPEEAKHCLQQALYIHRKIGDRRGEWGALHNLSFVYLDQGLCSKAATYGKRALRICREIGDRHGELCTLNNLGYIAMCRGHYARARKRYEKALHVSLKVSDQASEAQTAHYLGTILHLLGESATAHRHARHALRLTQALGDPLGQYDALLLVGHTLIALERPDAAAVAYQQALDVQSTLDDAPADWAGLAGLAQAHLAMKNRGPALTYARQAMATLLGEMPQEIPEDYCLACLHCARVLRAHRDPQAQDLLARARDTLHRFARRIQDPAVRRAFLEDVPFHRELEGL